MMACDLSKKKRITACTGRLRTTLVHGHFILKRINLVGKKERKKRISYF